MAQILIIDDDAGVCAMIGMVLRRDGHQVETCTVALQALDRIMKGPAPEVMFTDLRMDGIDGLSMIAEVRKQCPETFIVLMTAYAAWDTAVRAMHLGAYHVLTKPFDNDDLRLIANRAMAARDRWLAARSAGEHRHAVDLIGTSPALRDIQALIDRVSGTDAPILVSGEPGTGKELVARAIHYASLRADGPFVRFDATSAAANVADDELFGHAKGAFPGAQDERLGLCRMAEGGTLFLDEVADLDLTTQGRLLHLLEHGELTPLGGQQPVRCHVRVIAATTRHLETLVEKAGFRRELFWRLGTIPVSMPPLRDRREDIPLLAGHLLSRHAVRLRRGVNGFTAAALAALERHEWPGNVRELDQRIQRGVTLTDAGPIDLPSLFDPKDSPSQSGSALLAARVARGEPVNLPFELEEFERRVMAAALQRTGDNLTEAAELCGITFRQIRYRVRQLGLR